MTDNFYGEGFSVTGFVPKDTRIKTKTNFDQVGEFMTVMGQEVNTTIKWPDEKIRKLRYELIAEELAELHDAEEQQDIVAVADALTDLLYVVYGAGHAYGIDLDTCFQEVHSSNMTKIGPDGKVARRADGKVLKPPTYRAPDLSEALGLVKPK